MEIKPQKSRVERLSEERVGISAPAKLNLGLRVFPVRGDGFHDVETWMVPLGWSDRVLLRAGGRLELAVSGRSEGVPMEVEKNLAGRAALRLAAAAGVAATGRIELEKVVPPGGGMGGGSSDAASVLVGLNEMWGLGWSEGRLEELAAELGSDVPFFVRARASLCTGRGEIMKGLEGRHGMYAVLILAGRGCATKEVFAAFDAGHRLEGIGRTDWGAGAGARAEELNEMVVNDLELAAFFVAPWLRVLRDKAQGAAGQRVMMTGSGSTLFTLCSTKMRAEEIREGMGRVLSGGEECVVAEVLLRGY